MSLAIKMRNNSMVKVLAGPPRHTPTDAQWLYILALLEPRDLCAAAAVSRAWHRRAFVLLQTPLYWARRCGLAREQYRQYLDLRRQMRARTRAALPHALPGVYSVHPLPPDAPSNTPSSSSSSDDEDDEDTHFPSERITIAVQGLPGSGKSAFIRCFCNLEYVTPESNTSTNNPSTTATTWTPTKGRALVRTGGGSAVEVVMVEVGPDGAGADGADATVVLCDTGAAGPDPAAVAQHFAAVWRARCAAPGAGRVVLAASRCDVRTTRHYANTLALLQHAAVAGLPYFETSAAAAPAPFGVDDVVLHLCARLFPNLLSQEGEEDEEEHEDGEGNDIDAEVAPDAAPVDEGLSQTSSSSTLPNVLSPRKTGAADECRLM